MVALGRKESLLASVLQRFMFHNLFLIKFSNSNVLSRESFEFKIRNDKRSFHSSSDLLNLFLFFIIFKYYSLPMLYIKLGRIVRRKSFEWASGRFSRVRSCCMTLTTVSWEINKIWWQKNIFWKEKLKKKLKAKIVLNNFFDLRKIQNLENVFFFENPKNIFLRKLLPV